MTTITPRAIEVVLMQGDDAARAEELLADIERIAAGPQLRMNGEAVGSAIHAYNEHVEKAAERGVTLAVTAIPRRKFRALMADHPPRSGNEDDADAGFNVDTFGDDLVPACITTEFPSIADRDALLDSLSDAQWGRLVSAAVSANIGGQIDPKARLSSPLDQRSEEISELPDRLA